MPAQPIIVVAQSSLGRCPGLGDRLGLRPDLEELVQERTVRLEAANSQLQAEIAVRKRAEEALRESEEFNALVLVLDRAGHGCPPIIEPSKRSGLPW
jgi:phosphoglycerate-specific signal transduction histidine kinase